MAKDKKAKEAEKKARNAVKQNKKASKKEEKHKRKGKGAGDDSSGGEEDVDLDAVLAEYAEKQAQFLRVTEEKCDAPSARTAATLTPSPASGSDELFLFGGEYWDGALATFYNDLFVYNTQKDEWRRVTSPNSPLPRSGHAWCRGGNAGGIYLFGGEFSSPKQGTFYHYNDFWRLDPSSREWTRIETKSKGPPARSGHRMTYFKNYIVLWGGFQDTSQQTKYLQDLWLYDTQRFAWYNPPLPPASGKPDARSSFSFLPNDSGAVLYGGYSRVKGSTAVGKQGKGGNLTKSVMKPIVHQDTWFLRVTPPAADAASNALPAVRWERRKRPANPPNPPRAGATMAHHKGRGILFGGVHDVEESEEGIDSEFFDQLFAWNIERNRYFPLTLRRPRTAKKQAFKSTARRDRGKAAEEELLRNLASLDAGGDTKEAHEIGNGELEKTSDEPEKKEKPTMMEMPHRRFNAQLAVLDDVLFIYGGTYESGQRELTFDEMWSVDLNKLDGVKEIFKRDIENWQGSDEESSEGDSDEGDEDEEVEDETPENVDGEVSAEAQDVVLPVEADGSEPDTNVSSLTDTLPHPRPFESLRDFFSRTTTQWQDFLLDELRKTDNANAKSVKELRTEAFTMAENKWWDCREEIRALEDEQEEAGIGEVVSISERGARDGEPAARRR